MNSALESASPQPAPPVIQPLQHPSISWTARAWKSVVFVWKCSVGVLLCQSILGAILIIGWTQRLMQRSILKYWWKRSPHELKTDRFSSYLSTQETQHPHRHCPNWFIRQNWTRSFRHQPFRSLFSSLWLNLKTGLQGLFNIWVLTLPASVLWLFAWYDGWNNSFNKGYEQAPVGPLTGILGILLFITAMFYLPLAQARHASTGEWRSFYQLDLIWNLIRRHWISCLLLALLYSLFSLPVQALKTGVIFAAQSNPAIADFTPPQALQYLNHYFLRAALLFFPLYLILRLAAAKIYARGILIGVQKGDLPLSSLSPHERHELEQLSLIQVSPPRSRHVLTRVASTTGAWTLLVAGLTLTALVWFSFVAQIFIAEFFMYHPGIGWLNQPLVQLPWFRYIPPQLENPLAELGFSALLLLLLFGSSHLLKKLTNLCRKR